MTHVPNEHAREGEGMTGRCLSSRHNTREREGNTRSELIGGEVFMLGSAGHKHHEPYLGQNDTGAQATKLRKEGPVGWVRRHV